MRAIYTIAEREFRSLITAPLGYVVMTFFLFVAGSFFVVPIIVGRVASLENVVPNTTIWLVFLLPAITMRLLAEEKKQGTMELLMTSPITETQVVMGKFFGAVGYYLLILFSTLPFILVMGLVRKQGANLFFPTGIGLLLTGATLVLLPLAAIKESRTLGIVTAITAVATLVLSGIAAGQMGEWGPALTAYLGLLMLGAVFIAIGVLASSLTSNQIIAWVSTAAVLLLLVVLLGWLASQLPTTAPELPAGANFGDYLGNGFAWAWYGLGQVLQALNLQTYLENFAKGVLDLRDFVLYFSLIAVSLFFAVRAVVTTRAA